MRFIGNKENLLGWIDFELTSRNIKGQSFFDFFSGTVNVAKFFKKKEYQVYSCDLLYFSYVLQKAYIENNNQTHFKKLIKKIDIQSDNNDLFKKSNLECVIDYLNTLELEQGFIYHNYAPTGTKHLQIPRMYFTDKNAQKIDAIRQKIELWKRDDLLDENEYYILLAILIEAVPFYANISGVYAAFNKKWDVRTQKDLTLRPIELIYNSKHNQVFNGNSLDLIKNMRHLI
jgi:adenine-specific DNA-methyltransferase